MAAEKHHINWDPHFDLGIPVIDHDHRHMVELVNAVYDACERHQWDKTIEHAMYELSLFTVQHFNHEEEIMVSRHYPEMLDHIKAHRKLAEQLDAISDRIVRDGAAAIDETIGDFLYNWLIGHIKHDDYELAQFYLHPPRQEKVLGP